MIAEPPFARLVSLRVDHAAQDVVVEASAGEREAVALALAIMEVAGLVLRGSLTRAVGGFLWEGRLSASVTQACVVTHAPIKQVIDVPVRRLLVIGPAPDVVEVAIDPAEEETDYLAEPVVDLGAVAVEELSLALDPYPRAAQADHVVARYGPSEDDDSAPFAALARRRLDA